MLNPQQIAIAQEIFRERNRQDALVIEGRFAFNCASTTVPDLYKLPILAEEAGEVAREVCEISGQGKKTRKPLRTELIQLAAVCAAWIEALDYAP